MFFRHADIRDGSLSPDKAERVEELATLLPDSKIMNVRRRFIDLKLPDGSIIEGDVTSSGVTIYLGGFDWVTFPTPQHVLEHFPLPLPQQILQGVEDQL